MCLFLIMKIAKFKYRERVFWGSYVDDNTIVELCDFPYKSLDVTDKKYSLKDLSLLPPCDPQKIILVGLNYRDHALELNMELPEEPVIFMKPVSSLVPSGAEIIYPSISNRVDYEGELAFVISKKARNIEKSKASDYILGFTCLNDVTARDIQYKDKQWTRAKSFDTFCPIGPYVETDYNPENKSIKAFLNGKKVQDSNTNNFIFDVYEILSFVSNVMTLYPGDVISTGTPPGVGPMEKGDIVEISIEGLGILRNRVSLSN